jgi:hypothetical protein
VASALAVQGTPAAIGQLFVMLCLIGPEFGLVDHRQKLSGGVKIFLLITF